MLDIEPRVCTECGNLHMQGGPGPDRVDACVVCEGRVTDMELDDLIGL